LTLLWAWLAAAAAINVAMWLLHVAAGSNLIR
jgi:hypothetical protein